MSLHINDIAPDFVPETAEGTMEFHKRIGDDGAILVSPPKDLRRCVPANSATGQDCTQNSKSATARL
jgi:alkyl hydroperoxide reductase subunit AhpC